MDATTGTAAIRKLVSFSAYLCTLPRRCLLRNSAQGPLGQREEVLGRHPLQKEPGE